MYTVYLYAHSLSRFGALPYDTLFHSDNADVTVIPAPHDSRPQGTTCHIYNIALIVDRNSEIVPTACASLAVRGAVSRDRFSSVAGASRLSHRAKNVRIACAPALCASPRLDYAALPTDHAPLEVPENSRLCDWARLLVGVYVSEARTTQGPSAGGAHPSILPSIHPPIPVRHPRTAKNRALPTLAEARRQRES